MSSKAYFEKEIKHRMKELDDPEDILCIGSLSLASYSSSSRSQMLVQHLVQALVPTNPEVPGVLTGYEHMFGYYSPSYKKTDTKLKIIKKICKYDDYVYTLLVYDPKKDQYDIIQRNEVKNMAESYGYKYDNKVIDSYKEGDTIPKNTMLYKSPCFDENENFQYGVNAKVVYVVSQETIEDAVVVSESFAKKLSTTKVDTCDVPFNDNDIFLNLYGDNEEYKCFPDIGEKTKKSIVCATRRKNKIMDQLNMKNSNLKKIFPNDDVFQVLGNYTIVDIDIWCNKPYDELPTLPAYKQINSYYKRLIDYYTEIYETFKELIDNNCNYSQELSRLYAKARDFLDPSCRYADEDKMFSNMIIEFTMAKTEKLRRGCKLCGRFGNKSVISKVLPDEEMGISEDGTIPDVRMDALGVLGRLNSGQCIEQELNWMAETVRERMKEETSTKKQLSLLLKFIKLVNKKEYEKLVVYLETLKGKKDGNKKIKEFIDEILNDRIYIIQSPINCVSGDDLYKLYKEIQPKKSKLIYKDEYGHEYKSEKEVIIADEYILRLKQEPITKFSVRSKSMINPRTFLPIKSTKASKHKIIYPDQSNRIKLSPSCWKR